MREAFSNEEEYKAVEMLFEGSSYSEVASALRRSRGSIAGLLRRLRKEGQLIELKGKPSLDLSQYSPRRGRKSCDPPKPYIPREVIIISDSPIKGETPDRSHCHWPLNEGRGGWLWCNNPITDKEANHPYCEGHLRLGGNGFPIRRGGLSRNPVKID